MIAPRSAETIAMGVCMPLLATTMVTLRFLSKMRSYHRSDVRRIRRFGPDDYLILLPTALLTTLGGLLIAGTVQHGYGHQSDNSNGEQGFHDQSAVLVRTKLYTNIYNYFFTWMYGLTRISVLFFYRNIFRGRSFNIASWSLIAFCGLWTVVAFLFTILQCGSHVDYLWSSAANIATHCLSGFLLAIPIAAFDVFADLCVLLLPLFWIWKLSMSFWKKLAVSFIFLFGSLAIASSIVRLVMFSLVYPHHNDLADQLAYLTTVAYWGNLEGGLSITAACLPTLKPLFVRDPRSSTGWGVVLAYNLERGWCALSGRNPLAHPNSAYTLQGSSHTLSQGYKGHNSNKSHNGSQSGSSGTEALVGEEYRAYAYPMDDLEGKPQGQSHETGENGMGDLESQNVLITRDISVEHKMIKRPR